MDVPSYFKSLSAELEALKNRVRQFIDDRHWLTDGEWKEGVLRSFLRRSLPKTVDIGRGFIVTDAGVSRQIDVLIFDTSIPVLFRNGDLVFVTPDAVEGIIEVKSSINPAIFHEVCEGLIENAELVLRRNPRHRTYHKFISIFSFENQVHDDYRYLEVLRNLSNAPNRLLHFCCLGQDTFIRYWEINPTNPKRLYNQWHSYSLPAMTPGYFLHNVVEAICPHSVTENETLWYPVDSKEVHKTGAMPFPRRPEEP